MGIYVFISVLCWTETVGNSLELRNSMTVARGIVLEGEVPSGDGHVEVVLSGPGCKSF